MTSSQWLDIAVVAVAFVAAVSGWRSGALGSLLSFVGVVLGAVAGVLLAPHLVGELGGRDQVVRHAVPDPGAGGDRRDRRCGAGSCGARGDPQRRCARFVDSLIGVALQVVVVLVAAWLLATPLTSADQPNLAAAVRGSKVLAQVDGVVPPLAEDNGAEAAVGAVGHLRPARGAAIRSAAPRLSWWIRRTRRWPPAPWSPPSQPSVVKMRGVAPGCQKVLEGSGFVVAPNRVMSNAHVVAGSDTVTVESDGQVYDATVVSYDPNEDISILRGARSARPATGVRGEARGVRHRRAGARLPRWR